MALALQVEELVKRYGDVVAGDHLSFSVERREIFGLLGPNGAGKTTTLEIVEGLQRPDSGQVTVLGLDSATRSREIKARTGVQLQASSYYEYLTLHEILALLGSFYSRRLPPRELLELVGLADKSRRRIRQLSGGEQQRFALAASLINDPELVILDEPTTGLDPVSRRDLWTLVRQVRTVAFSAPSGGPLAGHPKTGGACKQPQAGCRPLLSARLRYLVESPRLAAPTAGAGRKTVPPHQ